MTEPLVKGLVPYSRFLEYRDRRVTIGADLTRRERLQTLERPQTRELAQTFEADGTPARADPTSARPLTGVEIS